MAEGAPAFKNFSDYATRLARTRLRKFRGMIEELKVSEVKL